LRRRRPHAGHRRGRRHRPHLAPARPAPVRRRRDDNLVRLWDLGDPRRPRPVATLEGFAAYVYSVQFSPDGRLLAAASVDDTVRIWDVSRPAQPVDLSGPLSASAHYALAVAFHPHAPVLAVGSADKNIYLWDVSDPRHPVRVGPPLV